MKTKLLSIIILLCITSNLFAPLWIERRVIQVFELGTIILQKGDEIGAVYVINGHTELTTINDIIKRESNTWVKIDTSTGLELEFIWEGGQISLRDVSSDPNPAMPTLEMNARKALLGDNLNDDVTVIKCFMEVFNGNINLTHGTGVKFYVGDGIDDNIICFSGTISQINETLRAIDYIPNDIKKAGILHISFDEETADIYYNQAPKILLEKTEFGA